MRGNTHVRFGGRTGKTERPKGRHRVPVRPYDLSRQRLDVHVLDEEGRTVEVSAVHPDADALRTLAGRVLRHGQEVSAVIESMTGSRFVHDQLERLGWEVAIADPVKAKGLAPLAAKTDKIDAHVLAELARRDLSFGHSVVVSDLFGTSGRELLAGFELPEPWATTLATSLAMLDELDERIDECGRELTRLGADESQEAHWLHRVMPDRAPVGQPRCPWAIGQEWAQVPALGSG